MLGSFNVKDSVHCHRPSQSDRLHIALNELSCSEMPSTAHCTDYTQVLTIIFYFQPPQESMHKSAKLPVTEIFFLTVLAGNSMEDVSPF